MVNMFPVLVIIMITFNVICHDLEEHQVIFEHQRAGVMQACV